MGQNVRSWQPTTPKSSARPRFQPRECGVLWDWASSSSGTTAPEYPQTQQEHRLSGTVQQNHQLRRCSRCWSACADVTVASRMRGGASIGNDKLTTVETDQAAQVGVGRLLLHSGRVRVAHGGQVVVHHLEGTLAGFQPPVGDKTRRCGATLMDGRTALSTGRRCGIYEGCSEGRVPSLLAVPTDSYTQTDLINRAVGRAARKSGRGSKTEEGCADLWRRGEQNSG